MNEKEIKYPSPYKVINNCLYMEKTNRQGKYDQKLCNFTPYIVSEITVNDGITETKKLVLGGEHESGRTLNHIEIDSNELVSFNWVLQYWGAVCNLEPGNSVKEHIRHAIQTTADSAEKKTVYGITGWAKPENKWIYLMPGDEKISVNLRGKLDRYEMEHNFSQEDIAITAMFIETPPADRKIIYPMIAYTFLTPLNEFLHRADYEPKFVLMLLGKTGTRKSTLAALMLSFFGRFTASDLPLSFRDTANSIMYNAYTLKDVLTCIDDFHPSNRQDEVKLTSTAQSIMRSYGDRTGRARLKSDSTLMDSRPPGGNAIITGEYAPQIGESGTARYFALELNRKDTDLELLSAFQNQAARGMFSRSMFAFTEMISGTVNKDEKGFTEKLKNEFKYYRDEFMQSGIRTHGRVAEMVAWLQIGMKMFLEFMKLYRMFSEEKCIHILSEFRQILYDTAEHQARSIEEDKPSSKFIRKLDSLIESGNVMLIDKNQQNGCTLYNNIGYEDENFYYLNKDLSFKAVRKLCEDQGESFSSSMHAVLKALAEDGLLETDGKQYTKPVRIGDKTKRFICINKSKAQAVIDSSLL